MKIQKTINYKKPYVGKDGKKHASCNFHIVIEIDGKKIFINVKPSFSNDYSMLDAFSEKIVIGNPDDLR